MEALTALTEKWIINALEFEESNFKSLLWHRLMFSNLIQRVLGNYLQNIACCPAIRLPPTHLNSTKPPKLGSSRAVTLQYMLLAIMASD